MTTNDLRSQSNFSFNPQKLAQPTTITYERIDRVVRKLQNQFRKSLSERGSYLEDA